MSDEKKKSTYTGFTEARKESNKRYMEKFCEIKVRVTPDRRSYIQEHAANMSESVNAFINRAIDEAMERDSSQANHRQTTDKPQASTESKKPTPSAPAAGIPKDTSKVDLSRLINDIAYQITVQEAFGKSILSELLDKARKQQEG